MRGGIWDNCRMILLFQKNNKSIFARLIRFWTRGPYNHVEIRITDEQGHWWQLNADNIKGVVWRPADANYPSDVWDAVTLSEGAGDFEEVAELAAREKGCGYDWVGILFAQILPLRREHPKKWFCSELVVAAMQECGYPQVLRKRPCSLSPNSLWRHLH